MEDPDPHVDFCTLGTFPIDYNCFWGEEAERMLIHVVDDTESQLEELSV